MLLIRKTTMLLLQLTVAATIAPAASAQLQSSAQPNMPEGRPVPVITGSMSFQSNFSPGNTDINPLLDPLVLLPIGDKLLIESEAEISLDLTRDQGKWGPAIVEHGIEFLQADYMVHPNLTITAGRFLTPFGMFRERMDPRWTRNLQAPPILFPLNDNSSNGLMLHGAAHVNKNVDVAYSTYYSFASTIKVLDSDRMAGFRTAVVLPIPRLEVGISYNHTMGDNKHNMVGTDVTWNVRRAPLDLRAEVLTSKEAGKSYWLEASFKLNKFSHNPLLRNTQLVFRQEQYWLPKDPATALDFQLPDANTKRSTFGLNYYLTHGIRLNGAYGGNYAPGENSHTWNVGITYRLAVL